MPYRCAICNRMVGPGHSHFIIMRKNVRPEGKKGPGRGELGHSKNLALRTMAARRRRRKRKKKNTFISILGKD